MFAAYAPALVDYIYMIDEYPARGGHAIVKAVHKSPGGAGANVAHNLATLGVKAVLFTTLGKDSDADFFVHNTRAKVIGEITDDKTGRVHVFVDSSGERTFFVEPNAAGKPYVKVGNADYLYLDPFPSDKSFELQLKVAREFENFVILNPGYPYVKLGFEKLKLLLKNVDMVILSESEFRLLSVGVDEILSFTQYLIITRGERGSVCYTSDRTYTCQAFEAKVVDTTGAGDAFAAGFIYGFIHDLPLDACLALGNFCGAYNVERVGARNFPNKEVIDDFLARVLR